MATEITVDSNDDGAVWLTLKTEAETVIGRHCDDKQMVISITLPESDVLKIRDYLNEKYPVSHDESTDSHRFDEPEKVGLYITQSGRFVVKDGLIDHSYWNFLRGNNELVYRSWDGLIKEFGKSEFPLRKAKAVEE